MSKQISLSSERLYYLPLDSSYCNETYLSWINDEEVTRYMEIFEPSTINQLEDYLKHCHKNPELLFWAIHLKENDKHIGNIKIDPINRRHGMGEYGIMMGDKTEWGKGFAKEASRTIIDYCFEQEHLRKITLGVIKSNLNALKLYKSLGFQIEGVYKHHGLYEGKFHDDIRMALFNPSFHYGE